MTGTAKTRSRNRWKFLHIGIDAAPLLLGVGDHAVLVAVFQNTLQLGIPAGAIHRGEQAALDDCKAAAEFAVVFVEAVAHDASDSLPRGRMAVHAAHEKRFAHAHANLVVATDAEIAKAPVGQFEDQTLHRLQHGTQLRVGVLRHRPFAVLVRMAGSTHRRRRITILHEQLLVRFSRFLFDRGLWSGWAATRLGRVWGGGGGGGSPRTEPNIYVV